MSELEFGKCEGEWDCGRRGSEYLQNQVTHWMQLPQPPVVSKTENTGKDLKGGEQ